jgi:hypothetical protein
MDHLLTDHVEDEVTRPRTACGYDTNTATVRGGTVKVPPPV